MQFKFMGVKNAEQVRAEQVWAYSERLARIEYQGSIYL